MEGCPRGPRFASSLIVELYRKEEKENREHYIKI